MDTRLNMRQTRDLTLYSRTMLVKSLSISRIVYAANSLFKFLWKTEKGKVKIAVVYQPFSHVGVNFECPHSGKITMLELSVRQVFLSCTNETYSY